MPVVANGKAQRYEKRSDDHQKCPLSDHCTTPIPGTMLATPSPPSPLAFRACAFRDRALRMASERKPEKPANADQEAERQKRRGACRETNEERPEGEHSEKYPRSTLRDVSRRPRKSPYHREKGGYHENQRGVSAEVRNVVDHGSGGVELRASAEMATRDGWRAVRRRGLPVCVQDEYRVRASAQSRPAHPSEQRAAAHMPGRDEGHVKSKSLRTICGGLARLRAVPPSESAAKHPPQRGRAAAQGHGQAERGELDRQAVVDSHGDGGEQHTSHGPESTTEDEPLVRSAPCAAAGNEPYRLTERQAEHEGDGEQRNHDDGRGRVIHEYSECYGACDKPKTQQYVRDAERPRPGVTSAIAGHV